MTLKEAEIGCTYMVTGLSLEPVVERRLEALGLFEGTSIELLNRKRSGTSIFKVRGTRLAVGPDIAEGITISKGASV